MANIEAMWAARCLKFNALAIKKMMADNFDNLGLTEVYKTFTYNSFSNRKVLLKDATVWELLNVPIDEGIDLFEKLLVVCKKVKPDLNFGLLFHLVKTYTMEELGVFDLFEGVREYYSASKVKPSCGKWFVPGSRHYSW